MNVYDTANRLAQEIKQSDEYAKYKMAKESINLNIPFLAYYGDWSQAPIFDKTYYEVESEAHDGSIDEEDKLKAEWTKEHQEELGVSDALILDIANYFKLGQRYTNPDIKAKLKELFKFKLCDQNTYKKQFK